MRRLYVPVRIHGGYGWKCVSYGTGCSGKCLSDKKLGRFGYITLTPNTKDTFRNGGNPVRGHEFHYFDSTDCGSAWHAAKPLRKRNWECIHATKRMMAGFPHLYYMASPHLALEFLEQCVSYRKEQEKTR